MPSALAIFTCRPNSHPFQERHVYLDEPIKIGRSVARCRPAQNNATFDCKVLSRNHALVWFDHKTGKVMSPRYLTIFTFRFPLPFLRNICRIPALHPEETFSKAMEATFCVSDSIGSLVEVVEWKQRRYCN